MLRSASVNNILHSRATRHRCERMQDAEPKNLDRDKLPGERTVSSAFDTGGKLTRRRLSKKGLSFVTFAGALLLALACGVAFLDLRTNPFRDEELYVHPDSSPADQAKAWHVSRPEDAEYMSMVASQPQSTWLSNDDDSVFRTLKRQLTAAASSNKMITVVAYNIPFRNCSMESFTGAESPNSYRRWIDTLTRIIGDRKVAVILEPDALPLADCLPEARKRERFELMAYAVRKLKSNSNTAVYVDAGHSNWVGVTEMSRRLLAGGILSADGFSLNVSAFEPTDEVVTYGQRLSEVLGGKHFVVDTSRNGNGSPADNEWCNPPGRALGPLPTTDTGLSNVDAYLWIKPPGESDGECNGGPAAGVWWPDYALDLARRARQ